MDQEIHPDKMGKETSKQFDIINTLHRTQFWWDLYLYALIILLSQPNLKKKKHHLTIKTMLWRFITTSCIPAFYSRIKLLHSIKWICESIYFLSMVGLQISWSFSIFVSITDFKCILIKLYKLDLKKLISEVVNRAQIIVKQLTLSFLE